MSRVAFTRFCRQIHQSARIGVRVDEPACLWESQTRMATMLRLEKYGRIDFSLGRWATTDQNAPKSMRAHARESFGLARTFFRSLSWLWESLFWTWSCICCKTDQSCDFRFLSEPFHISQHQYFTQSSPTTVAVHSIVSQCVEDNGAKKRDFDQN